MRTVKVALVTFAAAVMAAAVIFYDQWQHWLAYATGSYNCPKTGCPGGVAHNYNFFSGSGSDIGQITLVGSIVALIVTTLRKNNCEVHGCWRLGRHQTAAGHVVCRRHHPDDHLTAEAVAEAHEEAKAA